MRSIKCTMQMEVLRCKTPDMVHKEIWTHLLAYNLLRTVMAVAANDVAVDLVPDEHRPVGRYAKRVERMAEDAGVRLAAPCRLRAHRHIDVVGETELVDQSIEHPVVCEADNAHLDARCA